MTKEQHLELLKFRLSKIEEKRDEMIKNSQDKSESEKGLIESFFNLKFGGIEADIKTQIEWIEKNL